jgi:hypothetical protein
MLILSATFPFLERLDAELHGFLVRSEVPPYFALSWILTWFSHNFDEFPKITRLFDLFLASHPLMPLYVAIVIVLHRKSEIMKVCTRIDAFAHSRICAKFCAA